MNTEESHCFKFTSKTGCKRSTSICFQILLSKMGSYYF